MANRRYAYKQAKSIYAKKLAKLPPYLFVEIDKKKKELIEQGKNIISFGVGDPDLPTPEHIIKAGQKALEDPANHQYPFGPGIKAFREAVTSWYRKRFNVPLDAATEIQALIGSKEGIGHFPLAFINPGDIVLIPSPSYPVYNASTIFAGGEPYFMPLLEKNDFLPDFTKIPSKILKKAKLMFLNYPNNPTSATATKEFFSETVEFAQKYNIIVAHDAAYSEIYFNDSNPPISFLETPGAKDIGVEFHSLSKTYNMTGWRIAWVCGKAELIKGISTVKDNYDSGVFQAIQYAGITAITGPQYCVEHIRKIYRERRDLLIPGLIQAGFKVRPPEATFYVWAKVPQGYTSMQVTEKLLTQTGIVTTPGVGMGKEGEGYVRFSFTVDRNRIQEALERLKGLKW